MISLIDRKISCFLQSARHFHDSKYPRNAEKESERKRQHGLSVLDDSLTSSVNVRIRTRTHLFITDYRGSWFSIH
jgi:hypothetical protein